MAKSKANPKVKVKRVVKKVVKDEETGADVEREEEEEQEIEFVRLVRDEYDEHGEPRTGPLEADTVHPDEVQNWLNAGMGWRVAED